LFFIFFVRQQHIFKMGVKQKGTVAKWLNHKGIGFITPEGEEGTDKDVLVHFSQIKQETKDGFKSLQSGATVEFELQADPKNPEKFVAINVTGEDGAELEPRARRAKGRGRKGKGKGGKGKQEEEEEKPAEDA